METKVCYKCKIELPVSMFYAIKKIAGYKNICKTCESIVHKEKYARDQPLRDAARITREAQKHHSAPGYKQCKICKMDLPVDMFTKNSKRLDGKSYECKTCHAARYREKHSTSYESKQVKIAMSASGQKECTMCKEILPLDDFSNSCRTFDHKKVRCKKCASLLDINRRNKYKETNLANPITDDEALSRYKKCNRCNGEFPLKLFGKNISSNNGFDAECIMCERKRYKSDVARWQKIQQAYGITQDQYNAVLELQNGKCAICGMESRTMRSKHLYIDHDHDTGKIRGLLCSCCNSMLGHSRDNPDVLRSGAIYLENHKMEAKNDS